MKKTIRVKDVWDLIDELMKGKIRAESYGNEKVANKMQTRIGILCNLLLRYATRRAIDYDIIQEQYMNMKEKLEGDM